MNLLKDYRLLALFLLPCLWSLPLNAQTAGTLSTYSRFGLGLLHDQSQGFNKSMGGVGLGVRVGNRINTTNPASYSAIDSLSLIFDVGMRASFGRMTQGTSTVGINNASLDYVHAGMRIARRLGLAFGYMPYTHIGYEFSTPEKVVAKDANSTQPITSVNVYSGSGGLNQFYVGLGWRAYRGLSVGANASFLWGRYDHILMPNYMEGGVAGSSYSGTIKSYNASLKTYKLDFGVQYPIRMSHQDWLSLGLTYGLGHKIAQDAELLVFSTQGDTTTYKAHSPFDLPHSFGFGAAWQHKNTLLVAADVHHVRWGDCRLPVETQSGYAPMKGSYMNMTKVAVGGQYTPNIFGNFWQRIQYRAGVSFASPYLKIDGKDGPSEIRLGAGVGVPIINKKNNRSVVNFGLQWLRRSASAESLVKEDYFVINLGLTFNERWFMKYKIE